MTAGKDRQGGEREKRVRLGLTAAGSETLHPTKRDNSINPIKKIRLWNFITKTDSATLLTNSFQTQKQGRVEQRKKGK